MACFGREHAMSLISWRSVVRRHFSWRRIMDYLVQSSEPDRPSDILYGSFVFSETYASDPFVTSSILLVRSRTVTTMKHSWPPRTTQSATGRQKLLLAFIIPQPISALSTRHGLSIAVIGQDEGCAAVRSTRLKCVHLSANQAAVCSPVSQSKQLAR